ncbi:MAG: excinuclease ABC subunit UvrA, partial [Muribaculaceae bacterium]|nr:excinuclease ABC subunit UvrA [Muribaculaceae bacterium]
MTDKIIATDGFDRLTVIGARENNLKNIDVEIPHGKLTVITGLSGSGKSSLAFNTIFAEGQRRYIETFSTYARNMLGTLERPDVDKITGLNPVIAIEQKTVNKNPRSTIGTTTEIYDFLRLLYSRIGKARSYESGAEMVKYSEEKIVQLILEKFEGRKINILAPLVKNRKGHYKDLFESLHRKGYLHVRVDGELREIIPGMKLDRYKNHSIELVIDRMKPMPKDEVRVRDSVSEAMRLGDKQMLVYDIEDNVLSHYSRQLMDPVTGLSYREPAPHDFSFNSPQGACPCCKGLGTVNIVDRQKIMPDESMSIAAGGIVPLGKQKNTMIFWQIAAICEKYGYDLKTPVGKLSDECIGDIMNGTTDRLQLKNDTMSTQNYFQTYEGLIKYLEMQQTDDSGSNAKKWSGQFFSRVTCPQCNGDRLCRESLHFFVDGMNIAELTRMDIGHLYRWCIDVEKRLDGKDHTVAVEILKEVTTRLGFLVDVGLDYLQLNRNSGTLSGGESQRIRLATQLGSELVNVLYILDEPSIGLHQRDNRRLIDSLQRLRDASNSIIVVEHDKDIMLDADWVIDIGPGAGRKGGQVVFAGTPKDMLRSDTLTARYLNGSMKVGQNPPRRKGNGKTLLLKGCTGHNLKNVDFAVPLGTFTCVAGVSGSGKSSIVNGTLQPVLSQRFYRSQQQPLPYSTIEGIEFIDKVVTV